MAYVCHNIINEHKEQVVFFTNSSVDNYINCFIDTYAELFEKYKNLGLIGVSFSTKIYQSLLKNNFNPHVQTFFWVTKTSVIKRVMEKNGGRVPGENENYKLSIIRFGEAKLTKLVQKLGYDVAVVSEDENLEFFPPNNLYNNGFHQWKLPYGDYRLNNKFPNRINTLNRFL